MATSAGPVASLALLVTLALAFCASAAPLSDPSLGSAFQNARLHESPVTRHISLHLGRLQSVSNATRSMAEAEALPEPPPSLTIAGPARSSFWPVAMLVGPDGENKDELKAVEVQEKEEKDEIKEVMHYKYPGNGYKPGSPLYKKQQAVLAKTRASFTMKCIIFLTVQFFIVYTTLFITQTINRLKPTTLPRVERCLLCVAKTCYFIPMLCVLFLATRMRAVQLSQGLTDSYDLPQWWVKQAMLACTVAVCLQTVLAAMYYALLSKDPDTIRSSNPSKVEKALNLIRWLIVVCLYIGFMIVCVGLCTMQAPPEIWGEGGGPKVSPAVSCTIFLATLYFGVHFCIEAVKNVDEFLTPEGQRFGILAPQTLFLRDLASTVDVAPMLCILFLAARLRALQLDPKNGNPPAWAQTAFYVSSLSLLWLVLLCMVSAYFLQKEGFLSANLDEPTPSERPSGKVKAAEFLRFICMFFLCVSTIGVIISTFVQKRQDGPTPLIPPSIKCVMILTTVYFVVYTLLWMTATAKKLRVSVVAARMLANLENFLQTRVKEAIDFAPMLSVLFLGTLMRALQITGGDGAPPGWVQNFMYVGTFALALLTVSRLDLLLFPQEGLQDEGVVREKAKRQVPRVMAFFFALQHLCLLLMHIAVVAIIIGLFTMTAQTANGVGAIINLTISK